ncbi:MAG: hypothetical protein LBN36_03950, partial [Clostridiales Family XIII bacterium]|nr:hypothetical protein [Clostridiales Family XIII bacterium]
VYETNTRTEGPAGGYAARVYRIASENRTGQIWAPTDAIEKTFEVSETLKSAPEFRKHLIDENQWSGNLHDTPIRGDFLTWMIPDAFADAGMWETHQKFNDFFEAVNRELDEAFADGRLQEDDRIQIVGMSGGRTPAEIRALWPLALNGFENAIFYYDYAYPTNSGRLDMFDNEMQIYASGVKANYITNMYLDAGSFIGYFTGERRGMELFTMNLIRVYQATGIPIFLLSLVGLVLCLIRIFHKQKRTKSLVIQAVFMLTMLATTIAVIVGISWFVDFMGPPGGPFGAMKFYAVGAVPCVVVFEVLGLSNFYAACTARRSRKINETE